MKKGQTSEHDELDRDVAKELKRLEETNFSSLAEQVNSEYQLSLWALKPKIEEYGKRLKLYNNQRRDKKKVGDPLMFSIHQTVLAALYGDQLGVEFCANNRGDEEQAETLNGLALNDEYVMRKSEFDYFLDWDASFFGRALAIFMDFDTDTLTPIPEVWDPMTLLRDPAATSARGDARGRRGLRFFGREARMSRNDMKALGRYFNMKGVKADGTDVSSLYDANAQLRAQAQGLGDVTRFNVKGENADYRLLEWFTRYKGKSVFVTLTSDRKNVVRYEVLKGGRFPVFDRSLYPMAHDWNGVSIPDLTEDKQRARAALQNNALNLVRRELYPRYLYDRNKIPNRADLNREEGDKHIAIDGNPANAILPAPSYNLKAEVQYILDTLEGAAQRAAASPDVLQGQVSPEKRTYGEISLVASRADKRTSLSAKVFGWSEKDFWWLYRMGYVNNFKPGIHRKVARIKGPNGTKYREIRREDIIGESDPEIRIESRQLAEERRMEQMTFFRQVMKDMGATVGIQGMNARYAMRHEARLAGMQKEVIDSVLPLNFDELDAEDENERLVKGEKVEVKPSDDDVLHLEIHARADENAAVLAHIEAHKRNMLLRKERPELYPQPQQAAQLPGASSPEMAALAARTPKVA